MMLTAKMKLNTAAPRSGFEYFQNKYRSMIYSDEVLKFASKDLNPWHFYQFAISSSRFGRSLTATSDIKKGEKIACLPAIFVGATVQRIWIDFDGRIEEIDLDEHLYDLLPDDHRLKQFSHLSTFLDHACWPGCNALCDGHFWREGQLSYTLSAMRDIRKDENISIDYAAIEYQAEPAAQMLCACAGSECRQLYQGFQGLPCASKLVFIRQCMLEAPVAFAIWKSLSSAQAIAFAQHYRAGRPKGDGELFEDIFLYSEIVETMRGTVGEIHIEK